MHTGGDGNSAGGLNEIGDEEGNIDGERLPKGHVGPKHHADRTAEVLAGQGGDSAKGKIYGECLAVSPRGEVGDTASNRGGYEVAHEDSQWVGPPRAASVVCRRRAREDR